MSVRFGPAARLHSRAEFTAVQQHGRRVSARFLTMLGQPNTLGRDRLGLIASRRVGGAVQRNRAKRRLRELFRRQQPDRAAPDAAVAGWDVVVIARSEAATAPFAELETDFTSALRRLHGARRPRT